MLNREYWLDYIKKDENYPKNAIINDIFDMLDESKDIHINRYLVEKFNNNGGSFKHTFKSGLEINIHTSKPTMNQSDIDELLD